MSLLDEVSIMITPNGRSTSVSLSGDNVLFGVLPEPIIGTEIIINGDFDNDSDWTKGTGWTISGGTANSVASGGSSYLSQNSILNSGNTYKITFTISNYVSGDLKATVM